MISHTFTKSDKTFAEAIANIRNKSARKMGIPDQKIDSQRGSVHIDILGTLAEIAVARILKIPMIQISCGEPDKGYDLLCHGHKIDVKYSFYNSAHLIGDRLLKKGLRADIYVLVTGNKTTMKIVGFAFKNDFETIGLRKDLGGYGESLVLEQHQLRAISELQSL